VAGVAVASQDNTEDKPKFDFVSWLRYEAIPKYNNVNELVEAVLAKCSEMSDSELSNDFETIADALIGIAGDRMRKGDLESPMAILDTYWELSERVDGLYRSPRSSIIAYGLESDLHGLRGDDEALKKTNISLWKLLKVYDMMGDPSWRFFRGQTAFGLAIQLSLEGNCNEARAYLSDATTYANKPLWKTVEEPLDAADVKEMIAYVRLGLKTYFELKKHALNVHLKRSDVIGEYGAQIRRAKDAVCCDMFKHEARKIFDSLVILDPRHMPSWKDFKRFEKQTLDKQAKQAGSTGGQ
jgi:hypothetical protein